MSLHKCSRLNTKTLEGKRQHPISLSSRCLSHLKGKIKTGASTTFRTKGSLSRVFVECLCTFLGLSWYQSSKVTGAKNDRTITSVLVSFIHYISQETSKQISLGYKSSSKRFELLHYYLQFRLYKSPDHVQSTPDLSEWFRLLSTFVFRQNVQRVMTKKSHCEWELSVTSPKRRSFWWTLNFRWESEGWLWLNEVGTQGEGSKSPSRRWEDNRSPRHSVPTWHGSTSNGTSPLCLFIRRIISLKITFLRK